LGFVIDSDFWFRHSDFFPVFVIQVSSFGFTPMLLKTTHTTDLTYSEPISESVMELRMVPRQEADQRRLSFHLAIGPRTAPSSYFDWLGNMVHAFTINDFHDRIKIVATSVVESERPPADALSLTDTWPVATDLQRYDLYDFLQFGGPVDDSPALRELVSSIGATQDMPLGELAMKMVALIDQKFTYRQGVTTAASPITETLAHGWGVCQDFTHLMTGMARALNIPARYVSGLLHPQAERFRGYTQTHAWCELYFPSTGWIGFDPANKCAIADNFVKVAIGRDFRDVPPNKGIYRGNAEETIIAIVSTETLTVVPPELTSDRTQHLNVPTFPGKHAPYRDQVVQQQEHQQQQ
jgi:transglutaminase-like putative cysteine protease